MNGLVDFFVGEGLKTGACGNLFAEGPEVFYCVANVAERGTPLGHYARNRFVVTGDDDLLAASDSVENFAETGLGFEGTKGRHIDL